MGVFIYCSSILLLLIVVVEDFKYRAVTWWIFPALSAIFIVNEYDAFTFIDTVLNIGFILIQLIVLSLYFSFKEKKMVNITLNYLGLGDILFWAACSLVFSSLNFIAFYCLSLFVVLIVIAVWKGFKIKPTMTTVPLAGIQAATLLCFLLSSLMVGKISFRDDSWVEKLLVV